MSAVEQARAELMRRVTVWTEVRSESGWPLLRKEDAIDALIAAVRAEECAKSVETVNECPNLHCSVCSACRAIIGRPS